VGDAGTFLVGLALAADWLEAGRVEGCLVVAAEEIDWLPTSATLLFDHTAVMSDGAGALYLRREPADGQKNVWLDSVSQPRLFTQAQDATAATAQVRCEMDQGSD